MPAALRSGIAPNRPRLRLDPPPEKAPERPCTAIPGRRDLAARFDWPAGEVREALAAELAADRDCRVTTTVTALQNVVDDNGRLVEVADTHPEWEPIIFRWEALKTAHEAGDPDAVRRLLQALNGGRQHARPDRRFPC